jgi:hypothetical protein
MAKSSRQLEREIAEVLSRKRSSARASKPTRHHSSVKTSKTSARKLGSVGDVNPIDYGGGFIFSVPGGGGPHLEYFEGLDSDERAERLSYDDDAEEKIDKLKVQLYRVDLGKDAKDFLSDHDWVEWEKVATSTGQDVSDYTNPTKLRSAQARALVIQDAAGHYGWNDFDSYPLELTVGELKKRWGE